MTTKPSARLYKGSPQNLKHLAKVLRQGGLVAVPTETVYGLAGDALDARACRKIFRAKGRPTNDPLIVHIHSLAQLAEIAEPNEAALRLAKRFWPGPLTVVLPKREAVPSIVSSGLPSVAVRMPRHPLFRSLLKLTGRPLAAPSANPFGYVSPTSAAHVQASLGRRISHILDGGKCRIGVESTIVDLRDPAAPRLLRPGAITRAQLEQALGCEVSDLRVQSEKKAQPAPGRLARHYSPKTPALLHEKFLRREVTRSPVTQAWVFATRPSRLSGENIFWLRDGRTTATAARRLFSVLRQVDDGRFTAIHLERVPGRGLAEAINDRLQRAASKR